MNKKIYMTLCLLLTLCLAGCGSPSGDALEQDELIKTRATVTEVRGNTLLIRTEQGVDMTVPAKYLEGDVGPKAGMILEITSSPNSFWGFVFAAVAICSPASRSQSIPTTVVVPIS